MKWVYIALLVSVVIAPFDALYMYIKSEKRRDALKKRKGDSPKDADRDDKKE